MEPTAQDISASSESELLSRRIEDFPPQASSPAAQDDQSRIVGPRLFELRSELTLKRLTQACMRLSPTGALHLLDGTVLEIRLVRFGDSLAIRSNQPLTSGIHQVRVLLYDVPFVAYLRLGNVEECALYPVEHSRWFTLDRRQASRLPVQNTGCDMLWFDSCADGLEPRRAAVIDLTPRGLAVVADELPGSGLFPAAIHVGDEWIHCTVESRRKQKTVDGVVRYGLRMQTEPGDERLKRAYIARRFAELSPRHNFSADVLNDLFRRSGYLDLRAGGGVSEAWRTFSENSEASYDMVYSARDGSPLGHLSVTRAYRKTWILHQLATLGQHAESVRCRTTLYDLCSSVPALLDGDGAHALAYFDLNKRWHQLFFHEFVRWVDSERDAAIAVFDRFERKDGKVEVHRVREGEELFEIEPARTTELVAATALARSQLPAVLGDALDVTPWWLRSENLLNASDPVARGRTREVLILRERGTVRAAAFCECGPKAASLFNILNMAQIFVHTGVKAPSRGAQVALLAKVREYYMRRDITDPVIIAPKGRFEGLADGETVLAETMGAIAMNARALRQWENFCRLHFGIQSRDKRTA